MVKRLGRFRSQRVGRPESLNAGKALTGERALGGRLLFLSLCISIGFETLFFWPSVGNAYTVPKFAAVLVGGAILLPQVCFRLLKARPTRLQRLFLLLLGFQIIALTWATANSFSPAASFWSGDWRRMGWLSQTAMMTAAAAACVAIGRDFNRCRRLLWLIAALGVVSAGYAVLQWVGWDPFFPASIRDRIVVEGGGGYRSYGTIGQPAYYGIYLLYPFFAALALLVSEAGARRLLSGGAMIIIAAAIFSAAARSGLLGCAAGMIAFGTWGLLRRVRQSRRSAALIAASVSVAALLSVVGLTPAGKLVLHGAQRFPGMEYLASRLMSAGTDSASIGRVILWRDVVDRILPEVWLSGAGPGMFRVAFTRYRSNNYAQFGPDVHWENAHNFFLDRFTEQGVLGLLAALALIVAFFHNINRAIHASNDRRRAAACAAIGAGLGAVLVSQCFNGELVPTTYHFYLWIAISFGMLGCFEKPSAAAVAHGEGPGPLLAGAILGVTIGISVGLVWYAERNWRAETMLRAGEQAMNSSDWRGLLAAKNEAESATPHVGTYHLDFAGLIVTFLGRPNQRLDPSLRRRLAEVGIASSSWAVHRTDRPMLALLYMSVLGDMISDARSERWIHDLKNLDPYWFRPHEIAARRLLRQQKFEEALREATIAHQLAPYVESSANLWKELLAIRSKRTTTLPGENPLRVAPR